MLNGLKVSSDDVRVTSLDVTILMSLLLTLDTLSVLFHGVDCQI